MPTLISKALRCAPFVAISVSILILATHAGNVTHQVGWNGDVASRYVLGETLNQGAPGARVFSTQIAYTWVDALTARAPGHRGLWEIYPLITMLLALGALVWTLHRVAGRRVALLGAALSLAATPAVLLSDVAQGFHGFALAAMIGLDAVLVLLTTWAPSWRGGLLAVAAALAAGAVAATDPYLVLPGIVPTACAAVVAYAMHRRGTLPIRQVTATALVTSASAVAMTVLGLLLLRKAGYADLIPGGTHRSIVPLSGMVGHMQSAVLDLLDLAGGLPYATVGIEVWRAAIGGIFVIASIAAIGLAVWRTLRDRNDLALTLHVAFWMSSAVLLLAAYVVSDVVQRPENIEPSSRLLASVRYLVPIFFACAALVPIFAAQSRRGDAAVTVGVVLFSAWSAYAIIDSTNASAFQPQPSQRLAALNQALDQQGLSRGYASYWDAAPMTWNSNGRLTVLPAAEDGECGSITTTGGLCPWSLNSESAWYTPAPGTRTFVVVDPENDHLRTQPSAATFGTPRGTFSVGDLTVYVYNYDVASRFLATCAGRSDHGC